MKHFLSITDLDTAAMEAIFAMAGKMKKESGKIKLKGASGHSACLAGRQAARTNTRNQPTLVMLFEKPSLRTRLSFEVAMTHLGGHAVYLGADEIGIGTRESISDISRVASSMGDILVARVYSHATIYKFAKYASVPVINGLSDWEHPCHALSDLFTIIEAGKKLKGLKLAFVGDGENNIAHSLVLEGALWGMDIRVACPKGYEPAEGIMEIAQRMAVNSSASLLVTHNPLEAVSGADVVYTDTWVSMGDEADKTMRQRVFPPYQVNSWLMTYAKKDAVFMHDLPAYRNYEVTDDVIDGPQSIVFTQAENRLHITKALILYLLK